MDNKIILFNHEKTPSKKVVMVKGTRYEGAIFITIIGIGRK